MGNANDFVIENGILKTYKGSSRHIEPRNKGIKDRSAELDGGTQIATTVFRGYLDEVEQVIDYLGGRKSPTRISDEIYEYITSAIEIPKLKLALQQIPLLKVAMFVEFWRYGTVNMFYSRSGYPFVTDEFYAGECDFHADECWCWGHLPTEEHFKESALHMQTGGIMHIDYCFPVKGDWEANNYTSSEVSENRSVIIPSGVIGIGDYAFSNCNRLTSIMIPDGVTGIGNSAFMDCTGLSSITIPESVTKMRNETFKGCTGLTNITLPASMASIGDYAFSGCNGLTSITIPESVTGIGNYAFSNCKRLMSISLPTSVTNIGKCAFSCCSMLMHITFPESVVTIGRSAFLNCTGLKAIAIPTDVAAIDNSVFENCKSLTSVTIPLGVTKIGNHSFKNCENLETVTIPSSVTDIGYFAFEGCSRLTSIVIPGSVVSIGDEVFKDCGRLKDVTCSSDPAKELRRFMPATEENIILHIQDISDIDVKFRPGAAIGFAADERDCTDENGKKYLKYIKSNAVKLALLANEHPALFYLMLREKLIAPKNLEAVTTAVQKYGNAELIAAILDYGNSTVFEKNKAKAQQKKE